MSTRLAYGVLGLLAIGGVLTALLIRGFGDGVLGLLVRYDSIVEVIFTVFSCLGLLGLGVLCSGPLASPSLLALRIGRRALERWRNPLILSNTAGPELGQVLDDRAFSDRARNQLGNLGPRQLGTLLIALKLQA